MPSRLEDGYIAQSRRIRRVAAGAVASEWDRVAGMSDRFVADFVARAAQIDEAARYAAVALTDGYLAEAVALQTGGFGAPKGLDPHLFARPVDSSELWSRPFVHARTARAGGDSWPKAIRQARRWAAQAAATNVQLAQSRASQAWIATEPRVVGYRRVLGPGRNCGLCVVASTQRYHRDDLMPIHPDCVLPGTLVSVPTAQGREAAERGPIQAATRRRYEGEGVTLGSAAGNFVTVTTNHPVLTSHGWVPAGLLREGDHVVRSLGGHRVGGRVPDKHEVPTRVEDRFRALSVLGLVRVPLAAKDFHGDGPDGEVDVVGADGLLWDRVEPSVTEMFGEGLFARGVETAEALLGGRSLAALGFGGRSTTHSLMRGGDPRPALVRAGTAGAGTICGGAVAEVMASLGNGSTQDVALDAVLATEGKGGLACDVAGDRLWRDGDSTAAKFDAPAPEFAGEGLALHADSGRRLLNRLAGQVEVDRLVFVGRVDLASHVYNLQTAEGWYSANGLIVSNCGCAVTPTVGTRPTGQILGRQTLRYVKDQADEYTRDALRNLKIDVADLPEVQIVDHGELGPLLYDRRHSFATL